MKDGSIMLRKSWFVFWCVTISVAVPVVVSLFVFDMMHCIIICILYFLLMLWWALYYNNLEYCANENTICIKSGIFFQRIKLIYFDRILWETRVTVPFVRDTVSDASLAVVVARTTSQASPFHE